MKIVPEYNREMLIKYDKPLPRYTSYPTALKFDETFSDQNFEQTVKSAAQSTSELSLYFHIPFCRSPCFYCACSRIITRDNTRSTPYLDAVINEMALVKNTLNNENKVVSQVHLGGGTPTFLSMDQLSHLWQAINKNSNLDKNGEYSIEIDPRAADVSKIKNLVSLGFNRMSFGVQDLDKEVQKAVNRIQSAKETFEQIEAARATGVKSVNVDLIYGLPKQTVKTFSNTIDRVLEVRPERVAVYAYAHMPTVFKAQKQIDKYDLPDLSNKLRLLEIAIEKFQAAGYEYIGLDHFSLPSDELAIARRNGSLQRNFQGYSTQKNLDMLGFGVTSIGKIDGSYYQNNKLENEYLALIERKQLPVQRGYSCTKDDLIRKDVIMKLMCQGDINLNNFKIDTGHAFFDYFQSSLTELESMKDDGLIEYNQDRFYVTAIGQLLLRNIANVFDAYRTQPTNSIIPLKRVLQ